MICSSQKIKETQRREKQLSLFSIVQFPNLECSTGDTTTPYGICLASSECTTKGGASTGNCAAGFGVCCVVQTSTCGSTVSANSTYIRNPGYPSTYTPSNAGTCTYTINKANDDVCQLRLDFILMSGHTLNAASAGGCSDTFTAVGQTGVDPPAICGTNTGYHMYVEFGTGSTDSITLTNTWAAAGLTTAKNYNILARQICCTDTWKAPTNCVQYFTGLSGSVETYNHQGGNVLQGMNYQNCVRTEKGYCKIQWKQSSTTTPDPFGIGTDLTVIESDGCAALNGYVGIPTLSPDGVLPISTAATNTDAYQNQVCGGWFGIDETVTPAPLVSAQQPFVMNIWTTAGTAQPGTGVNMDWTQQPC